MSRLRRPRFTMLDLMEAMATATILAAFWSWRFRGYYRPLIVFEVLTVVVTGISALVLREAWSKATRGEHHRQRRWIRMLNGVNVLIALWMISTDRLWSYEACPACRNSRETFEYRFASMIVLREIGNWQEPTTIGRMAIDLGVPCTHSRAIRRVQQRWMGLCLLTEDGGIRLGPDHGLHWYPSCARAAIRGKLASDPAFAQTFRRRVLEANDREYLHSLEREIEDACETAQAQESPDETETGSTPW